MGNKFRMGVNTHAAMMYCLSPCVCVCVPSWVSQSGLDLPATRAQHKRRNQVARQAGSQLVTHFDQLESSRVSQVATVATCPPCLPLLPFSLSLSRCMTTGHQFLPSPS